MLSSLRVFSRCGVRSQMWVRNSSSFEVVQEAFPPKGNSKCGDEEQEVVQKLCPVSGKWRAVIDECRRQHAKCIERQASCIEMQAKCREIQAKYRAEYRQIQSKIPDFHVFDYEEYKDWCVEQEIGAE